MFQIKNPRWADYWQQQAYAVMLVIRTSDGEIRWMNVSAYLKRESAGGKTVRLYRLRGGAVRCGECAKLAEEGIGRKGSAIVRAISGCAERGEFHIGRAICELEL